jgi:hypothetical protein
VHSTVILASTTHSSPIRMFTRLSRPFVRVIAWTPVALVFLDHGYTLAVVQGRSMQVDSTDHTIVILANNNNHNHMYATANPESR